MTNIQNYQSILNALGTLTISGVQNVKALGNIMTFIEQCIQAEAIKETEKASSCTEDK